MSRQFYWIISLVFVSLIAAKFDAKTGFTSLIRFGETWESRRHVLLDGVPLATVPHSNGYDGQFYAQIALDPALRHTDTARVLDVPAYRARRILTPAIASIAGLGSPWLTIQIYALLNVACWFALGWLLAKALPVNSAVSCARWLGCMFSMGVLESVRQSLVDLPALVLLMLAISASDQSQRTRSIVWLALGNLAKESNLLGALALCLGEPKRPIRAKSILLSFSLAATPLMIWAGYVAYRLPTSAETNGTGNFTWPLLGLGWHLKTCLAELLAGNWDGRFSMGLLATVGFSIQAGVLWRQPDLKSSWWRIGAIYSLLLLFLSSWVWSGYWAVSRAVLPMTIAFNLFLPAIGRTFWLLWALGNLSMLHALWRFI